jgi:ATP-dependent Clp protease ATP-binding subunit ClpA
MFERYTEKARRTIFFARYEASQFGSPFIETEHLLLGVLREDRSLALRFLGGELQEGPPPAAAPPEVMETEQRIKYIVHRMENAIANQELDKARFYSNEERLERENLRLLHQKYNLHGAGEYQGSAMEAIRRRIEAHTGRREKVSTSVDLPLSHYSRRVLSYAAEEAEELNHQHIGTEHLLLGLLREEKCFAAEILHERGLHLSQAREDIARLATGKAGPTGFGTHRPRRGMTFDLLAARFASQWMATLEDAGRAAQMARLVAASRSRPCIESTDLLLALTYEKEVAERLLGPVESIRKHANLSEIAAREKVSAEELAYSEACKQAFKFAIEEAAQLGQRTGPGHLLLGILRVESCAAAGILHDCGLTEAGIRAQLRPPPPSSDPEQGRSYV